MPIAWTAEMDRKFLLAILETSDFTVNYAAVAAKISTEDQPCTTIAAQRRLQKLKAMVKAANGADGVSTAKAKGKTTPRKRHAGVVEDGSPAKTMKHSSAKEVPSDMGGHNEDDDETVYVKHED